MPYITRNEDGSIVESFNKQHDGQEFLSEDSQEYKDMLAKREMDRVKGLKLTKRVFALALQQLGVSYSQLKALIATNEQAQLEWDLCVELQRDNPMMEPMAMQLGITPEQLDMIFKIANEQV